MIRSILLVIALLSGGGALVLTMHGPATSAPETSVTPEALDSAEGQQQAEIVEPPVAETEEVLSVMRDIAEGDELRPSDFAWIDWPSEFLMSGFIIREDEPDAVFDLAGTVAAFDLSEGEPVLGNAFEAPSATEDTGAFVAAIRQIGPGMRPVSLPVELARPLDAILRPGDRVDLVHVYFPDDSDVPVSRILVPAARLLAIDPVTDEDAADLRSDALHNVVLSLSVRDATEVLGAAQVGSMSLLLRAPDDAEYPDLQPPVYQLAQDIASGRRAFVLSGVDLAATGQVQSGDRVDIIFNPGPGDDLWPSSRALVSNARVIGLAIGIGSAEAEHASASDRVTLELDPAGVEAVTTALQRGQVSISLRPGSEADARYQVHMLPGPAEQVRVRRAGELQAIPSGALQ
jgi:pilus assembly protein CpaB